VKLEELKKYKLTFPELPEEAKNAFRVLVQSKK